MIPHIVQAVMCLSWLLAVRYADKSGWIWMYRFCAIICGMHAVVDTAIEAVDLVNLGICFICVLGLPVKAASETERV